MELLHCVFHAIIVNKIFMSSQANNDTSQPEKNENYL